MRNVQEETSDSGKTVSTRRVLASAHINGHLDSRGRLTDRVGYDVFLRCKGNVKRIGSFARLPSRKFRIFIDRYICTVETGAGNEEDGRACMPGEMKQLVPRVPPVANGRPAEGKSHFFFPFPFLFFSKRAKAKTLVFLFPKGTAAVKTPFALSYNCTLSKEYCFTSVAPSTVINEDL